MAHLHRIFPDRHNFANPPVNPKVVIDVSFSVAAAANLQSSDTYLVALVGPARYYTTECNATKIIALVGAGALPALIKILPCLHSSKDDNCEACIRMFFGTYNPKEFFLATVDSVHFANEVRGLPIISLSTSQPIVARFSPASASQIAYADQNTLVAINERKEKDKKSLKNRKKNLKRRFRQRGSR